MKIALTGNPNSGKTTLYNALTGKQEHVGNWAGVTVSKREAKLKSSLGKDIDIIDLPGAYSIRPYTSEESVTTDFIKNENLRVRVVYLDVEDFRSLNGYGKDKKHYSTRIERIPNRILAELMISSPDDYKRLLPTDLPDEFVASELSRAIKRTSRYTFYILKLLVAAGAVEECGKRGRAVMYRRIK